MTSTNQIDELLADGTVTVGDAQREFGLRKSRLYEWMASGVLPYSMIGDRRYIPRVSIKKLLAAGMIGVEVSGTK